MGDMAKEDTDRLADMLKNNKLSTEEWDAALGELMKKYEGFPLVVKWLEELGEAQEKNKKDIIDLNALTTEWVKDFQSGLVDAIVNGKNLGDVLSNIGKEIASIALEIAFFGKDGMTGWFGDFFGDLFGKIANADGNAFRGGRVVPFADGGVVTRPTVFPMANGLGLMGEAGAEAVMPLARDSRGRLGVRASGAGGTGEPGVTVNVENRTSTPIQSDGVSVSYDEMERLVVGVVLKDQATNGPITRNYRIRR
jgi:hypothetical protein